MKINDRFLCVKNGWLYNSGVMVSIIDMTPQGKPIVSATGQHPKDAKLYATLTTKEELDMYCIKHSGVEKW